MDQLSYDALLNSGPDAAGVQRGTPRDSLLLGANMRFDGVMQPVQVRVRNLSPGGLMAEYTGGASAGEVVEIEVRGLGWVRGSVAWVTDGRVGIAFDRAIDPLAARKPVGGSVRR